MILSSTVFLLCNPVRRRGTRRELHRSYRVPPTYLPWAWLLVCSGVGAGSLAVCPQEGSRMVIPALF
ncbi:hypothetical protein JXA88_02090 [Candidatus Fermentibacteria bacterium]|nr:hypothetical protein [Candidatus Fermentibacteria bacterium]